MVRSRWSALAGVLGAAILVAGAGPAAALSFLMPEDAVITNLVFDGSGYTNEYSTSGSVESFDITMRLTKVQFQSAPDLTVTSEVLLSITTDLIGSSGTNKYDFTAGSFTLTDEDAGLIYSGSFDAPAELTLVVAGLGPFAFIVQGTLESSFTGVDAGYADSVFFNAMGVDGQQLAINIASPTPNNVFPGSGGSFNFTATGAMIPAAPAPVHNPEPGTGLLLVGGLLGMAVARRRRIRA